MTDLRARARDMLSRARSILILTGAGVSAESGVPTFRGPEGLWRSFRPEELATPDAFARDPRLVWEWYDWRRRRILECRPNAAHRALAAVAAARHGAARIATQNVDGLHAVAAGEVSVSQGGQSAVALPLELHGSLFRVRCTRCGARRPDTHPIDTTSIASLPHCDRCDTLLRPDVVWFGEPLDDAVLGEAFERARDAAVCLVVGTSALVQPAASLAAVTKRAGGSVIEINPDEAPLTRLADVSIRATAADAVPDVAAGAGLI